MAMNDTEALEHVGTILADAAGLYDEAAELAPAELADELALLAGERRAILSRVKAHGMSQGKMIRAERSALGKAHRAFMNLRAVVEDDAKAAVAEVERAEDYLRDEIRAALDGDALTIPTRMFLAKVKGEIRSGHARMSGLKHALERKVPAAAAP